MTVGTVAFLRLDAPKRTRKAEDAPKLTQQEQVQRWLDGGHRVVRIVPDLVVYAGKQPVFVGDVAEAIARGVALSLDLYVGTYFWGLGSDAVFQILDLIGDQLPDLAVDAADRVVDGADGALMLLAQGLGAVVEQPRLVHRRDHPVVPLDAVLERRVVLDEGLTDVVSERVDAACGPR